jgi:hypothetical protein
MRKKMGRAAVLCFQRQQKLAIDLHGPDLGSVADDPAVLQKPIEMRFRHECARTRVKSNETGFEGGPFAVDHLR